MIGTLRREGFNRILVLGRRHLAAVLTEHVEHYNANRPHRSRGQRCPRLADRAPVPSVDVDPHRLRRVDRLGGPMHEYQMTA